MILSFISFGFKYWKAIVSFATGLALGFGAAWWIQGVRVDIKEAEIQKKKVEIISLKKDLKDCQEANKANQETIEKLKDEVAQSYRLCAARLKINNRKAGRIIQIDEIKPYLPQQTGIKKDGGKDEKVNSANVGDTLLNELSGMFNDPAAGSKDGIHKTDRAGTADSTAVLSCQMAGSGHTETVRLYCLDSENAKNLLKNREIDKAYTDELRAILDTVKEPNVR